MSTSTTDHLGPNGERPSSIRGRYQSLLWASMDRLGIADSLERKMMAAVVLQFCSTLAVFALPIVFLGPTEAFAVFPTAQIALTGVVFVLAVAAFVNTLVITREDVISPLERLRADADRIASGDLEERPADPTQADEIGELQASFTDMHDSLTTVAAQADALAREEFDASVLAQRVPGEFGDSLERMQTGSRAGSMTSRRVASGSNASASVSNSETQPSRPMPNEFVPSSSSAPRETSPGVSHSRATTMRWPTSRPD